MPILLLWACTNAPSDDGTKPPPLDLQSITIEANPRSGTSSNAVSRNDLQPLTNSSGKRVITGKPIPAVGKLIHPDSVAKPKVVKVGSNPKQVKAHTNVYIIPENLKTIAVNEGKLKKHTKKNSDSDFVLTNSFGDTIPSGTVIMALGKHAPSLFPKSTPALPLRMKDNAIYDIQYLDVDQGMSSPFVRSMLVDKAGNLWFGTYNGGVSRYDGKSFVHFTETEGLSNNTVWCILEDKSGNLWFGTDGGVSRYDGQSFVHFTEAEGLSNNHVLSILEDKAGNLWFGTNAGGVCKFEPSEDGKTGIFVHFTKAEGLSDNSVWSIAEDKKGNLWFGAENGGVSKYEPPKDDQPGTFVYFTEAQGLLNNTVRAISLDEAGNIWFGTNGGVNKYIPPKDGKEGTFVCFTEADGLSNNRIISILKDKTGNLWFGTQSRGVNKYDEKTFTHFTEAEGLSNNMVTTILEDRAGNLWFGTNAGGASRYNRKTFVHFTESRGLSNNFVRSMLEDKNGNFWFGTFGGGVTMYDGKNLINFTETEGLSNNIVRTILEDKTGNIWFGTEGGVCRYDGKNFVHFNESGGLSNNIISSILEDKYGNFWIGTLGKGITRYEPGKNGRTGMFIHYTEEEGLSNNRVWSIVEDKNGNLWFGTEGGGVSRFEPQKDGRTGTFIHFTKTEGISDNNVWTILEDNSGRLWFDSQVGQVNKNQFSKESHAKIFVHFSEIEGFPNNSVRSILKDRAGNIWFGTQDKGAYKYDGKSFYHFTKADGLSNNIVRSILEDKAGNIWFGTQGGGVSRYGNNTYREVEYPPEVHLRQLIINDALPDYRNLSKKSDQNIKFESIQPFENYPIKLRLPYDQNHLSFNFSALDWSAPNKILYSYRMLGLNNKWSIPTEKASAEYWNMPHGIFTFQIRAIGKNKQWSSPFEYTFTIGRPWWISAWAFILYGLLLIASVFLVDRVQRRRLILKEREKTKDRELAQAYEIEKAYIELKATQYQLIQSEKMASLGELTAGIAHEIQNPLNFVNNFSEISDELIDEMNEVLDKGDIEEAKAISGDIKQNLEKISAHGKRADNIVKGMLQHSRGSSGKKEPTDINALCDEYLRLSYHGFRAKDKSFNADFKLEADENLPKIEVVPQDIGRVLLNLINNAFYAVDKRAKENDPLIPNGATEESGKKYKPLVALSTFYSLSVGEGRSEVKLSVKDNGPGIPSSIKDKIFQPFFTTKPTGQGTGLGLSLSYDIVKAHGGTITVQSAENKGSEFILTLPVKI